jgi:hypothetical protein
LWLDGFSTFPGISASSLNTFVSNGGILLVQSPGFGGNSMSEYPLGNEITGLSYTGSSGGEPGVHVVNSASPIMSGLTDAGLTWATSDRLNASGHVTGSIGSFQGLADNGTSGQWVTLAQKEGAGEIIYTFEDISRRLQEPIGSSQALGLLQNILGQAATVPEPSTSTMAIAGIIGLAAVIRLKRA